MQNPKCPKCSMLMDEGFVVDHGYGADGQSEWVEGRPQKSFWSGIKITDKLRRPVFPYCCPGCGFLESYARPEFDAK